MPTANVAAFCIVLFALASWKYHVLETEMKEAALSVLRKVPVKCDANVAESWAEK